MALQSSNSGEVEKTGGGGLMEKVEFIKMPTKESVKALLDKEGKRIIQVILSEDHSILTINWKFNAQFNWKDIVKLTDRGWLFDTANPIIGIKTGRIRLQTVWCRYKDNPEFTNPEDPNNLVGAI